MQIFQQIGVQTVEKLSFQIENLKGRVDEYESLIKMMKDEHNREVRKLKADLNFQTK